MKHTKIHYKALFIDEFVGYYNRTRKRGRFPHKQVGVLIKYLFPNSKWFGNGNHKTAFRVWSDFGRNPLVLKVGSKSAIKNDLKVYNRIPESKRNRYFAKIYHKTNYCILQKYGKKIKVSPEIKKSLKAIGKRYGFRDVRDANIRFIKGRPKIVDASIVKN